MIINLFIYKFNYNIFRSEKIVMEKQKLNPQLAKNKYELLYKEASVKREEKQKKEEM